MTDRSVRYLLARRSTGWLLTVAATWLILLAVAASARAAGATLTVQGSHVTAVAADGSAEFLATVQNGATAASGVVYTATLSDADTITAATWSGTPCAVTGPSVRCVLGTVTAAANVPIDISVIPQLGPGVFDSAVTSDAASFLPWTTDSVEYDAEPGAIDLYPDSVSSFGAVQATGVDEDTVIDVANDQAADASDVVVSVTVPAGVSLDALSVGADGTCAPPVGNTATCTLPTVTAHSASAQLTITAAASSDGVFPITTSVSSINGIDVSASSPTTTTNVVSAGAATADLRVVASSTPASTPGATTSEVDAQVCDNGPSDATNVSVDVTSATGVITSVTPDGTMGADCTLAIPGGFRCTGGTVVAGSTPNLVVAVARGANPTTTVEITAGADEADRDATNNGRDVAISWAAGHGIVTPAPNMQLTVAVPNVPTTAIAGNVTFDLATTADLDTSTLTFQLPPGVAPVLPSECAEIAPPTVLCDEGAITALAGMTTLSIPVTAITAGRYSLHATMTATAGTATLSSTVAVPLTIRPASAPTLTVETAAAGTATVDSGEDVALRTTVTNTGADTTHATATITLPVGFTYDTAVVSDSGACTDTGVTAPLPDIVTCMWPDVPGGSPGTPQSVHADVTATAGPVGAFVTTSTVSSSDDPPGELVRSASAWLTVQVAQAPDLDVTVATPGGLIASGANVVTTVHVSNTGTDTATGVAVTLALPSGLTVNRATPSQGSCSALTCTLGSVPSGAVADIRMILIGSGAIDDVVTATAMQSSTDADTANDSDSSAVQVFDSAAHDLSVDLEVPTAGQRVQPGQAVQILPEVDDSDTVDAAAVSLRVDVPPSVRVDQVDPADPHASCTVDTAGVTCTDALLTHATAWQPIISATAITAGAIDVGASAWSDDGASDPDLTDNVANATFTVVAPGGGDLEVTGAGPASAIGIGDAASVRFTVTNRGSGDSTGAQLVTTVPAGLTLTGSTPGLGSGCSQAGAILTCQLGSVLAGESVDVDTEFTGLGFGVQAVTAAVSADGTDPTPADNATTVPIDISTAGGGRADLRVSLAGAADVSVGSTGHAEVLVANAGPDAAEDVIVTAPIPQGVTVTRATPSQSLPCTITVSELSCALNSIGVTGAAHVLVSIVRTAPGSDSLVFTAATDQETDPVPANSSAAWTLSADVPATASSASVLLGPVTPMLTGSATVMITNPGTAAAHLGAPVLTGQGRADLTLTDGCGPVLAAGASCPETVHYAPTVGGATSSTTLLLGADHGGVLTIPIAALAGANRPGTGVSAPVTGVVTAAPGAPTGTVSAPAAGTAPAVVSRVAKLVFGAVTGPASAGFSTTTAGGLPLRLSCSVSCRVHVNLYVSAKQAKTLGLLRKRSKSVKPVYIGYSAYAHAAGKFTIRCLLTQSAQTALGAVRGRPQSVRVSAVFAVASLSGSIKRTTTLTLRLTHGAR